MLRIFLSAVDLVTPPVAAIGASFGMFIAQTHSNAIGDSSAVTVGLAMGARMEAYSAGQRMAFNARLPSSGQTKNL